MADHEAEEEVDTYISGFVRFSMIFYNFLIWLFGGFLIGLGVWAYIEKRRFYKVEQIETVYDVVFDISVGIIVVGCVLFVIPMLGFIGAIRENIIILRIFAILVGIIFGLEVLGTILAFALWGYIEPRLTNAIKEDGLVRYQDNPDVQVLIDFVQEWIGCCGVGTEGYKDWSLNLYFNCSAKNPSQQRCAVPYSCCKDEARMPVSENIINYMCGYGTQSQSIVAAGEVIYTAGCLQATLDVMKSNVYYIAGVLLVIALCQIASVVMADYMIAKIKRFCKDCQAGTLKRRRPGQSQSRSPLDLISRLRR